MEQILLIIIAILLLAFILIIYVVRLIFRVSHPISHGVVAAAPPANASSGSNIELILFILLLSGIVYLSMGPSFILQSDSGEEINSAKKYRTTLSEETRPTPLPKKIPDRKRLNVSPKGMPLEGIDEKNAYIDRSEEHREIDRLNQSPEESMPVEFYAIQVHALEKEKFAQATAVNLSLKYGHVAILYIPKLSPYKVVIAPFDSKAAAKEYKRLHKIEGFIRAVDRSTPMDRY